MPKKKLQKYQSRGEVRTPRFPNLVNQPGGDLASYYPALPSTDPEVLARMQTPQVRREMQRQAAKTPQKVGSPQLKSAHDRARVEEMFQNYWNNQGFSYDGRHATPRPLTALGDTRFAGQFDKVATDLFHAGMVVDGAFLAGTGVKALGREALQAARPYLNQAYRVNPFAFKPSPNAFYRQIDGVTLGEHQASELVRGKQAAPPPAPTVMGNGPTTQDLLQRMDAYMAERAGRLSKTVTPQLNLSPAPHFSLGNASWQEAQLQNLGLIEKTPRVGTDDLVGHVSAPVPRGTFSIGKAKGDLSQIRSIQDINADTYPLILGSNVGSGGAFNQGVYDIPQFPGKLLKIENTRKVANAAGYGDEYAAYDFVSRMKGIDNPRIAKIHHQFDLPGEFRGLVLDRVSGKPLTEMSARDIRAIPTGAYTQFFNDAKQVRNADLGMDWAGENFMYDPRKGFTMFDINPQIVTPEYSNHWWNEKILNNINLRIPVEESADHIQKAIANSVFTRSMRGFNKVFNTDALMGNPNAYFRKKVTLNNAFTGHQLHLIDKMTEGFLHTNPYQKGGNVNATGYTPGYASFHNPYNVIPSGDITMRQTPFPVLGIDNRGAVKVMQPGEDHHFAGKSVMEFPLLRKGGSMKDCYQSGGQTLYVDSKNDPRYRAYQDSLRLYNAMQLQDRLMGNETVFGLRDGQADTLNPSDWSSEKKELLRAARYGYNSYNEMLADPKLDKKHKDLVTYYRKIGIPDKNIGFHASPDLYDTRIKPIGSYNDGYALSPVFKKPVRPVAVRQEDPMKLAARTSHISVSNTQAGLTSRTAVPISIDTEQHPTGYSFTFRDDTGQQQTQYFPNLESWQTFTDQNGYNQRSVTNQGRSAQASGLKRYQGGGQASRADSLAVYNNAKAVRNYYERQGGYQRRDVGKDIWKLTDVHKRNELSRRFMFGDLGNAHGRYLDVATGESKVLSKNQYYRPLNANQYLQREVHNGVLDTRAPMILFDKRITPHSIEGYQKTLPDFQVDGVEYFGYDPIAVKPWDLLTPTERKLRIQKYGYNKQYPPAAPAVQPFAPIKSRVDHIDTENSLPLNLPTGVAPNITGRPQQVTDYSLAIGDGESQQNYYFPSLEEFQRITDQYGYIKRDVSGDGKRGQATAFKRMQEGGPKRNSKTEEEIRDAAIAEARRRQEKLETWHLPENFIMSRPEADREHDRQMVCIGGVCSVLKTAGAVSRDYYGNGTFEENARREGFGWPQYNLNNIKRGDVLQHFDPEGPSHGQMFMGVTEDGQYEFYDNYDMTVSALDGKMDGKRFYSKEELLSKLQMPQRADGSAQFLPLFPIQPPVGQAAHLDFPWQSPEQTAAYYGNTYMPVNYTLRPESGLTPDNPLYYLSGKATKAMTQQEMVDLMNDKDLDREIREKLRVKDSDLQNLKPVLFGISGQESNHDSLSMALYLKEQLAQVLKGDPSLGQYQIRYGSVSDRAKKAFGITPEDLKNDPRKSYIAALDRLIEAKSKTDMRVEQGYHPGLVDQNPYFRAAYYYNQPHNVLTGEGDLRGDKGSYMHKVQQAAYPLLQEMQDDQYAAILPEARVEAKVPRTGTGSPQNQKPYVLDFDEMQESYQFGENTKRPRRGLRRAVITQEMTEDMNELKYGGLPRFQTQGEYRDDDWIRKILEYEAAHGMANGSPHPTWGFNSRQPKTIEEAIGFYKSDYLPKVQGYPAGLRERLGDYVFNTGRSPQDLLLYNAGKISLDQLNSPNVFTNEWNQYKSEIEGLYGQADFVNKLDQSRNDVYRTTKQVNGQPNPAYAATWQGRLGLFGPYQAPAPPPTPGAAPTAKDLFARRKDPLQVSTSNGVRDLPQGPFVDSFNGYMEQAITNNNLFGPAQLTQPPAVTQPSGANYPKAGFVPEGYDKAMKSIFKNTLNGNIPAPQVQTELKPIYDPGHFQYGQAPTQKLTQYSFDPRMAHVGLGVMGAVNQGLEAYDRNHWRKELGLSDARESVDFSRGDYTTNGGFFRPDQYTPTQFRAYAQMGGYFANPQSAPVLDTPASLFPVLPEFALPQVGSFAGGELDVNPAFRADGSKAGSRDAYAYQYFKDQGLPEHVAAGIVGNLSVESGFDPDVISGARRGDHGTAFGVAQWRGERQDALKAYAQQTGRSYKDLNTQLDFVLHEARQRGDLDALQGAQSPSAAAEIFMKLYERPSSNPKVNHVQRRMGVAENLVEQYRDGGEYLVDESEVERLRALGYDVDIL